MGTFLVHDQSTLISFCGSDSAAVIFLDIPILWM